MRDMGTNETGIDKLMALDPDLANEIQSVAKLQKQIVILRKSNNSLRNKKNMTNAKLLKDYELRDIEVGDLRGQLYDKEKENKILQFKLKEITKGKSALNISEKEFLDVNAMVSLTGSSKLPLSLYQKQKEAGESFNARNMYQ